MLFIGERIKATLKRIMTQFTLNNRGESSMKFSKINSVSIKINLGEP